MDILERHIGKIKAEFQKLDSDKQFYKKNSEQLLKNSSQLNIITNDKDLLICRSHQVLKLEIETLKKTIEEEQNKNALLQAEKQDLKENLPLKNVTEEIQRLKKIILDELEKNTVLQVEKQDLKVNLHVTEEDIKNNDAGLVFKCNQALREEIKRIIETIFEDERYRHAVLAEKENMKEHVQVINGPMEALWEENQSLKKIIEDERKNNAVIRVENDDLNVNYGNLQRALGYLRFEYRYLQEKNKDQPENKDALLVGSEVMDHINLEVELGHVLCDNKQLTVEKEDLKVQLYDMALNRENSVHECHLLRAQNGYLQATIEKLQEDILQSTNKALQSKIKKLEATNKDIQKDRDMLQGDNNTLQSKIKKLEATNKDIQEDRDMLQRDNNTLQANIKELEATDKDIYEKKAIRQKNNNDVESKITEANMEPQENDGLLMNENLLQENVKAKTKAFEEKGIKRVKDLPRQVCYGEIKPKNTSAWKTCKSILKHEFKKNSKSKGTSKSNDIDLKQGESDDELNGKMITPSSKKISKSRGNLQINEIRHEQLDDEINVKIITHRSRKNSKSRGNPQSNDIGHEQLDDELNVKMITHRSKKNSKSRGNSQSSDIDLKQGESVDELNVKMITHRSKTNYKSRGNPKSNDIEHEQSDKLNGKMITYSSKKISKSKGVPQSNDIEHELSDDEFNGIISTHRSKKIPKIKGEAHSDGINMKQGESDDKLATTCDNEHQPDCSGSGLKAKRKHKR